MQHFSDAVIATNERIIIWAVLGFEEECVFIIIFFTIYGHDSQWSMTILIWNLVEIGQVVSEEKLFNNIMILYMYTTQGQGG